MNLLLHKALMLFQQAARFCTACFDTSQHSHRANHPAGSSQPSSPKRGRTHLLEDHHREHVALSIPAPYTSTEIRPLKMPGSHVNRFEEVAGDAPRPSSDCKGPWNTKTKSIKRWREDIESAGCSGSATSQFLENLESKIEGKAPSIRMKSPSIPDNTSRGNQPNLSAKDIALSNGKGTADGQEQFSDIQEKTTIISTDNKTNRAVLETILKAAEFQRDPRNGGLTGADRDAANKCRQRDSVDDQKRGNAIVHHAVADKSQQRALETGGSGRDKGKEKAPFTSQLQEPNKQSRPSRLDPRAAPFKFSYSKTPSLSAEASSFETFDIQIAIFQGDAGGVRNPNEPFPHFWTGTAPNLGLGIQGLDGTYDFLQERAVEYSYGAIPNQLPVCENYGDLQCVPGPSSETAVDLDLLPNSLTDISVVEKHYVGYYISGDSHEGSEKKNIEYFTPTAEAPKAKYRRGTMKEVPATYLGSGNRRRESV